MEIKLIVSRHSESEEMISKSETLIKLKRKY